MLPGRLYPIPNTESLEPINGGCLNAWMHLLYYDEVKFDPPIQPSYWLGGICVRDELIPEIEDQVGAIAERAFGSRLLTKDTEFHGIEICRGSGNFKGRDFEERLAFLEELLGILSSDAVQRIRVRINPANITHSNDHPSEIAFMFFVECAESIFEANSDFGMLFGDYDEPIIGTSVATLSNFRKGGTRWARGKDIKRIIDTVHFAKSHHSRMIQLADIFLYCSQFCYQSNQAPWRTAVEAKIKASNILSCTKQRDWPSEPRWYR